MVGRDGAGGPDGVVAATVLRALELLERERAALDALNVFPVPDRDTGTNLVLTFRAAARALDVPGGPGAPDEPDDAHAAPGRSGGTAARAAHGALVGARGNSGVMAAQYLAVLLRGLSSDGQDATGLAEALGAAASAARRVVAEPVEGTVLTVADDAAAAARRAARPGADAVSVSRAALGAAVESVGRTPALLPALRRAGSQDAGGWGLVLLLASLHEATGGAAWTGSVPAPGGAQDLADHEGCVPDDGEFEVMALLRTDDDGAAGVRAVLGRLGSSVATTGDGHLWQVHVHTDHVAPVLDLLGEPGLGSCGIGVRHLHVGPPGGVVLVTAAPGLVPSLARAGGVVLLSPGAPGEARPVGHGPLARAVEDAGTARPLVLAVAGAVEEDRVGGVPPAGPGADVRGGLHEAHLVSAATAMALAGGQGRAGDLRAAADGALQVPTATVDRVGAGEEDRLVDAARSILPPSPAGSVLTVLTRAATSAAPVAAAVRALERIGVEVVVLGSGASGTEVELVGEPR